MTKRKTYVCDRCGSDEIMFDAYAGWDVENQCMSLVTTFDKGNICNTCGESTRAVEVLLDDS